MAEMNEQNEKEGTYIMGIYQSPVILTIVNPKEKLNELEKLAEQGKIKRLGAFEGDGGILVNFRRTTPNKGEQGKVPVDYRISATYRAPRTGIEDEKNKPILKIELPSQNPDATLKDFQNLVTFYTPSSKEFTTITVGEKEIPKKRFMKEDKIIYGELPYVK